MPFIIIFLVVLLDQSTKFLVQAKLTEGVPIPIIPNVFYLTYIKNPGAAFGILAHRTPFFVLITLVVIGVIAYFYRKVPREWWLLRIALAMQVGGAIGNLIDRIRFARVIDFLDFRVWSYIFNLADTAIVIGSIILAVYLLKGTKKQEQGQQSEG
ncbi:MAG TPA: signal peptidase II [Desulfobacteria bacterium]|nr:signal peptidase II [Desulfobacteria bacterium]